MKVDEILHRLTTSTHLKEPKFIWDLLYTYQESDPETQSFIITKLLGVCQQSIHNPVILLNNSVQQTPDNTKLHVLNYLVDLTLASEVPDKIFDLISFLVFYCDLKKAHIDHLIKKVKKIDFRDPIDVNTRLMLFIIRFFQLFLVTPRMTPPYSYFYFNAIGSGIALSNFLYPFKKALSMCMWLRIEYNEEVSRIFTFHSKGHGGLELYLVDNSLFYRSLGPEYTVPVIGSNGINLGKIPYQTWTYVAFYHKSKDSLHKSQLKVVINDAETLTSVMDFPNIADKDLTLSAIGLDFYGQISCLMFFNDVLPVDKMKSIHQHYNYGPHSNESLQSIDRFVTGGLSNHLILLLHPERSDKNLIYSAVGPISGQFLGITGSKTLNPRKITSLGGICMLIPILSKVFELEDCDLLVEWFRLLTFCIKDRPDNQNEAVSTGFFKLLSVQLEEIPDFMLTEDILNIIDDLKNCGNNKLPEQIFVHVLWNLRVWSKGDIPIQCRLFVVLKGMYAKNKALLKLVGLDYMLEKFKYVTYDKCQEAYSELIEFALFSSESNAIEVFIKFLSIKHSTRTYIFTLKILKLLVCDLGHASTVFIKQVIESKGIEILMSLLSTKNIKIKQYCVNILEHLLATYKLPTTLNANEIHSFICKCFNPENSNNANESDASYIEKSIGQDSFLRLPRVSMTVMVGSSRNSSRRNSFNMGTVKWDENLYHASLEIMLNRAVEGQDILDDSDFISSVLGLKILMYVAKISSYDVKHKALQDQLMLTKWNQKNCSILIQNQDWHFWLLNLILETFENSEAADAIVDIGIRLHNTVLVQAMSLPEGYQYFEQINTWLEINSSITFSKLIIRKVLENFLQSARKLNTLQENHWKNFLILGYFLEEFVLYSNSRVKSNLEESFNYNRTWEDSSLTTNYAQLIHPLWSHNFGSTNEDLFKKIKDHAAGKLNDEKAALNYEPENELKKRGKFGCVLIHLVCSALKATEDQMQVEFWLDTLTNILKTMFYISAVHKKTLIKQESRFYSYCISYVLGYLTQIKQKHPCTSAIDGFLAQFLKLTFASLSTTQKKSQFSGLKSILKLPLVQYYCPCDYIVQMISRTTTNIDSWISTFSNFSIRDIQQYLSTQELQNALFYLLFQVQSFFHSEQRTALILQDREKNSEKYLTENLNMTNHAEIGLMKLEDYVKDIVHEIRITENSKFIHRQLEKEFKYYKKNRLLRKLLEKFNLLHDKDSLYELRLEKKMCKDFSRPFLTKKMQKNDYVTSKKNHNLTEGVLSGINFKQIKRSSFLTEEEELDILEELKSKLAEDSGKTSGFSSQVGIITPMAIKYGYLFIKTSKHNQKLIFRYDKSVQEKNESGIELFNFNPAESNFTYTKSWKLNRLVNVFTKGYLMRPTAVELLFSDGKNVTLNFLSGSDHIEFLLELKKIKKMLPNIKIIKPKVFMKSLSLSSYKARTVVDLSVTEKWQNGVISNFEYLMYLNYCAGRSYNDLTQYPVMPWIIADYISDLPNAAFRDLCKNMGSLGTPERTSIFEERYKNMQNDATDPPFHFGSHYSNPGITLFYLIRVPPFDECSKELQGGKFDLPDRLFSSISDSFHSAIDDIADVREIIPEFFYLPEMFMNINSIEFGMTQSGENIGDVKLPDWAENAYEFTRIHKDLLESETVSLNLNKWIDLIFGYKQQGQEAEKAMNVFYYLTYENNVDVDKITDQRLLLTLSTQMYYFGRTPTQIFTKPHPVKKMTSRLQENLITNMNPVKVYLSGLSKIKMNPGSVSQRAIVKMKLIKDKEIHCIRLNRSITKYTFMRSGLENSCYFSCDPVQTIEYTRDGTVSIEDNSIKYFNEPFTFFNGCKSVAFGGFWDGRVQVRKLFYNEITNLKFVHYSTVTCIEISESENFAITGSKDGDCVFWVIKGELWIYKCSFACHDDEVTCIAISENLNVLATCSFDGFCCLYSIFGLKLMKNLSVPNNKPITIVRFSISSPSRVFLYCPEDRSVYGFSLNGVNLNVIQESANILCLSVVQSPTFNDYIVYSNDKGEIIIRNSGNFELIRTCSLGLQTPISSFLFTSDLKTLLVGCSDGEIAILTQ